MSSTYSPDLRIQLLGAGDEAGTWGSTTNNTFAYLFESAIAGYQTVTISSTSQALSYIYGASSTPSDNQAVYAMLNFTGASAATSIYAPPASKQYILKNSTSYAITIYNSTVIGNTTAAGSGVSVAAGVTAQVWSDGTNFYAVDAGNVTGIVAIAHGGTGATTLAGASIATYSGIETLTNKTLTAPTINAPTITSPVISTYGSVKALFETATITAAAPSATTNFDIVTQAVQYYTSNATTNFTLNIRGDGSTALNSILSTGQAVTCTLMVTNGSASTVTAGSFVVGVTYTIASVGTTNFTLIGASSNTVGVTFTATGVGSGTGTATTTAFYPNVIQVDGTTVTPKWQTGVAASPNYLSAVTVYTFSIIKTASATFTVLGSQVKFA